MQGCGGGAGRLRKATESRDFLLQFTREPRTLLREFQKHRSHGGVLDVMRGVEKTLLAVLTSLNQIVQ